MLFHFACEAAGAFGHPAFPAPSVFWGTFLMQSSGASRVPRAWGCVLTRPILRDARRRRAPQDEVGTCGRMPDPHGEEAQSAVSNHEVALPGLVEDKRGPD